MNNNLVSFIENISDENLLYSKLFLLLKSGIDIIFGNSNAQTPLLLAYSKGFYRIFKLLLEYGSDPNVADINGVTPLIAAFDYGYTDIFRILLKFGADPNVRDNNNNIPIWMAYNKDYYTILKYLLDAGADPDITNNDQTTLLMQAIKENKQDYIILILKFGANIDKKDNYGNSSLMWSVIKHNLPVINHLIKLGGNVNTQNNMGETPLFKISSSYGDEIVNALVKSGADINIKNNDNMTPLMNSIKYNKGRHAYFLIKNGADVNVRNNDGETALIIANKEILYGVIKSLILSGANEKEIDFPFKFADFNNYEDEEPLEELFLITKEPLINGHQFKKKLKFNFSSEDENISFSLKFDIDETFDQVIEKVAKKVQLPKHEIFLLINNQILWNNMSIDEFEIDEKMTISILISDFNMIDWDEIFYCKYIPRKFINSSIYHHEGSKNFSEYIPIIINDIDWYLYSRYGISKNNNWHEIYHWKNHIKPSDNIIIFFLDDEEGFVIIQKDDFIVMSGQYNYKKFVYTEEITFIDEFSPFKPMFIRGKLTPENMIKMIEDFLFPNSKISNN